MLNIIFWIILGFIGLFYGAKFVIIGLENIANKLNISHLMVGLTVLAIGTSLPEIAVSVIGGIDKLIGVAPSIDGIIIGNKVGSFLTQITLIFGILGLSQNIFVSKWELRREGTMLFLSIFIFFIFALDLVFTNFEGILFMISYVLYLVFVIWSEKRIERKELGNITTEKERLDPKFFEAADSTKKTPSIKYNIGIFLIGLLILITAAEITVLAALRLAKELNVPVLALSQLSRAVEHRPDQRPRLSDLRESGSLEQDADVVMFIYREDKVRPNTPDQNIAEIIVAKHRNGPVGSKKLYFNQDIITFKELEEGYETEGEEMTGEEVI